MHWVGLVVSYKYDAGAYQIMGWRGEFVAAVLVFGIGLVCHFALLRGRQAARAFDVAAVEAVGLIATKRQHVQRVKGQTQVH